MCLCVFVVSVCYIVTFQIACKSFDGTAKILHVFEFFLDFSKKTNAY